MSILIFVVLLLGIGAGMFLPEHISAMIGDYSSVMLLILLFSVGIDMGLNKGVFAQIKQLGVRILLIPIGVILGSLAGGALASMLVQLPIKEGFAISSGLGWYSLSGILLTEAGNPVGGTISFLSNVFREMISFVSIPFLAKHLNGYTAIAPAGATAMDTTLGVISKNTDSKFAVLAFVSGVICTLVVPVLVPIFL
ncbi:lysine exporter LysO family protein [Chakrabartyella piscis]|uniref:lysine exporter LysO family protein n=1 Tax=Chakrabartyella piscis TaxID=2918914 RepID=UPI00295846F8|nr:lysine exporter LysO family protein [Chakrabartyella piscis]